MDKRGERTNTCETQKERALEPTSWDDSSIWHIRQFQAPTAYCGFIRTGNRPPLNAETCQVCWALHKASGRRLLTRQP